MLDAASPVSGWDIVDVVMYIVTETIILAFFHNPEYFRNTGVTQSHCGELAFETQEAAKVFELLDRYVPVQLPSSSSEGSTQLFQIHHGNQLRVSWPRQVNDEVLESAKNIMLKEASFCDGALCTKNANECTHHHHSSSIAALSMGMVRIERIIIPYGHVTFAAFRFTPIAARLLQPRQTYYKHYVHCNPSIVPMQQENIAYASHNSSTFDFGKHTLTAIDTPVSATDTSNTMSIGKLLYASASSSSTSTICAGERLARLSVSKSSTTALITGPLGEPRECAKCHTQSSPEWRKGPSGNKTLCNACGLRFSRFIAKQKRLSQNRQQQSPP
ncbi:hypothetical protein BX666DRAFT_1916130 [Dichotomocladium elegans]|nr:hypothetical protein BX666DRAFT_1916130 [Dichotomocladium elegans]